MGRNNPKGWKNGIFVPFFSLSIFCFVVFTLRNRCVSGANEYWFWGWVLIRCWLFHCGFVDGCFIADEYFFASECFFEGRGFGRVGRWIGWFDWMRGWLGIGRRCSYARAYARSRTRSFVFLLSQVSQRMRSKILHHPQKDVSFYRKWRVVLLKTTCRFTENNVSFYWKQRVVLWKVTCCFGLEVEKLFWGWCFGKFLGWSSSVKVWQCGMLFLKSM